VAQGIRSIEAAAEEWLDAEAPLRDERTNETYALYAATHWHPFFERTDRLTEMRILEYRSERLRRVSASTVSKELGALRAFLRHLGYDVVVPGVPRRATGVRDEHAWKGSQELSPDEVATIILSLPRGGPCERYVFAHETSLRHETIDLLETPAHWTPGAHHVTIPRELDKARAGRPLPLTAWAAAALEASAARLEGGPGRLFEPVRWRKTLKGVGRTVLGADRGNRLVPTDIRAARVTHLLEQTGNLPGVQFMAGHSRATTTALYVRPSLRAAEAALGDNFGGRKNRT
jgi:integrase